MNQKIIFLSYTYWPPDFGGELLVTIERLEELSKRGYEVLVLTSGQVGYQSNYESNGIKVLRSPSIGKHKLHRVMRRLVYLVWSLIYLITVNFDVVHIGSLPGIDIYTNTIVIWLYKVIAVFKKAKMIYVYSLSDRDDRPVDLTGIHGYFKGLFLSSFSSIIAVSPVIDNELNKIFLGKTKLIVNVARNDIFTTASDSKRYAIRDKYGVKGDDVVFIFLGTVSKRKGFDLLAKAYNELNDRYPNWKLWVIGPYRKEDSQNIDIEEVIEIVLSLEKSSQNVTFFGRINDRQKVAEIMAAADIFIFPTRREGMPIAPLEAMAVGLPIIISKIPGVTDLANIDGVTGLFCKPDDVQTLKTAMIKLGINKSERIKMGKNAQLRVQKHFGWEQHIESWNSLYNNQSH